MKHVSAALRVALAAGLMGIVPWLVARSAISAPALAGGRLLIAGLALLIWAVLRRSLEGAGQLLRRAPVTCLALAVTHATTVLLYFVAARRIAPPLAALLLFSGSVYVVPLSAWLLREPLRRIHVMGVALAAMGLISLFAPPLWRLATVDVGHLAGLASGVTMASVYLLARKLARPGRGERPQTNLGASLALLQHLLALPAALLLVDASALSPQAGWLLPLLGVVCTALPFSLIFSASRQLAASELGLLLLLEPLTPLLLTVLGGTYAPGPREWVALGALLAACLVAALPTVGRSRR